MSGKIKKEEIHTEQGEYSKWFISLHFPPKSAQFLSVRHQRFKWTGCWHEAGWINETRDLTMTHSFPKSPDSTSESISGLFILTCSFHIQAFMNMTSQWCPHQHEYTKITLFCTFYPLNNTFHIQTFRFPRCFPPNVTKHSIAWLYHY